MSKFTQFIETLSNNEITEFNFYKWFTEVYYANEPNKLELLLDAIKNNLSLNSLKIHLSEEDEYFYPIIDALFQKPLSNLELDVGLIPIEHAKYLAKIISKSESLKSLTLYTSNEIVQDEVVSAFFKTLEVNFLEELKIESRYPATDNTKPGNVFAEEIHACLEKKIDNSSLNKLSFVDTRITDKGAKAIAEILKVSSLSTLDLFDTTINDEGLSAIVESINNSRLTTLRLDMLYKVGAKVLLQVAEMLKTNKVLEFLQIFGSSDSRIDDESAYALVDALKSNESLSLFLLGNFAMSKPAAEKLVEISKSGGALVLGVGINANTDFVGLQNKFNQADSSEKAKIYRLVYNLDESKLSEEMQEYREKINKMAESAVPKLLLSQWIFNDSKGGQNTTSHL